MSVVLRLSWKFKGDSAHRVLTCTFQNKNVTYNKTKFSTSK